jgi:NADH dehydrogenase (ubiquinone) 1 alpha subcomplex subunit 13
VGGFEAIRYKRNLPLRGPSGLAILGGVTALCAYGFYRVGKGNLEKRCVRAFKGSVNGRTIPVCGTKKRVK